MSQGEAFDPELRELLGEVARAGGSALLQIPRSELQAGARAAADGPPERLSARAPFLRRAERRLLEVHREELARLLFAYAVAQRHAWRPDGAHHDDCTLVPPERDALDRRNRALARTWARDLDDLPAVDLLRACLRHSRRVAPVQLTAAGLRIAPSARMRIAHAVDLVLCERLPLPAARLLHGVLAEQGDGVEASYAWENLAWIEPAAELFERAVCAERSRVVPSIWWLRLALRRGSPEGLLRAARQVEEAVPPDHPALAWCGTQPEQLPLAEGMPGGIHRPGRVRLPEPAAADARLGPVARRVLAGEPRVRTPRLGVPAVAEAHPR